jgi:hypothetical protein
MENFILIGLIKLSELFGFTKLVNIFEVLYVNHHVQIVVSTLSTEQMVNIGQDSWTFIILVEVLDFLLENTNKGQLLEPHIVVFIAKDK